MLTGFGFALKKLRGRTVKVRSIVQPDRESRAGVLVLDAAPKAQLLLIVF